MNDKIKMYSLNAMIDRSTLEQMIEEERRFSKKRTEKAIQKVKKSFGSFKPLEKVYSDGEIESKE
ncbi:hypothetical protein OEA_28100 (plasmid) [Priestia megaterium NCT-2]|uniref:hypothetical protein n=1 Tax=Priestia megaterium TaxID=1404 RepID=UPI000EB73F0F|nr:hypothetical protein [Priestia megaterium]AYE53531.1 hypothetical protein OEA_28100 [Priestia megaterium NCT-2]